MPFSMKVKLNLPDADALIKRVGLDPRGPIQRFHDQNILRRIQRYMPYKSGGFIETTKINTVVGTGEIVSVGPHAAYLYFGKVMVDSKTGKGPRFIPNVGYRHRKGSTLKATSRNLDFNREKNSRAGPYWDKALIAYEGDAIIADLQDYIDNIARRYR